MKKMKVFFIFLFALNCLRVYSQLPDYHVQLFDESFGVRTSDLRKIILDNHGFAWTLYDDRVERFDGKNVTTFILGAALNSIICDQAGMVWVSSPSKLYRFINEHKGFVNITVDTVSHLTIHQVCKYWNNEVWVVTNKGFYVFDENHKIFRKHPDPILAKPRSLTNRSLNISQRSQVILFGIPDTLIAYNPISGQYRFLPIRSVQKASLLTDDLAFVSTWEGELYLYNFSKGEITKLDLQKHLTGAQDFFIVVYKAISIGQDKFLLATSKGLLEYNLVTGDFRNLKLYFKGRPLVSNLSYQDLFLDQQGTVWAVCDNYGLITFKLNANEIGLIRNNETDPKKAWDNHVRNFAEDDKGNLWLATVNGFVQWNIARDIFQPHFAKEGATDRLNHNSIRGIVYDGHYLILGPTNKGIWLYDPLTDHYRRPTYLPGESGEKTRLKLEADFIDQIYTLQNGDHIAAARDAAYLVDGKTYRIREIDFPGNYDNLNFTYEDSHHNIWIGTEESLYCLDTTYQSRFKLTQQQTSGQVNAICESWDGSLIIGGDGLHRITFKNSLPEVSVLDSFFEKMTIHILYRDEKDRLWLATSEGLFNLNLKTGKIESFSHFESIEGNSFYANSLCHAKNGMVFMGSSRGIIYFNPEQMEEEKDSLHFFISKIIINEDDSSYTATNSPFQLKYFQNAVTFYCEAPYYGNANKLKYRYRLEGLNPSWIDNGNNNIVRFHPVQPGHYVFEAAASINGVDWFESKDKIAFHISPPFWNTWWFYILVVLGVAGPVYALYRYQLHKKMEVEKLRLGIARDLHDDIGSALSNIHIISSMAMKKQQDNATVTQVFSKIKDSSKAMLENMQDIVWAINPDNDTIEQVLARMKEFAGELCDSAGMEYSFTSDENLDTIKLNVYQRKDMFLIFKEAMNNAVKYSGGDHIRITLHKPSNSMLVLQILDNGKGFNNDEIRHGNGLRNMNQRAGEMKGQIRIDSGNGDGTMVELKIPIT